jgi:general secretion pathway protein D
VNFKPESIVKTFCKLFLVAATVLSAQAQPVATNPVPSLVPRRSIRTEGQATNGPGSNTNLAGRPTNRVAGTLTNVAVPATNAAGSLAVRNTNMFAPAATSTGAVQPLVTGATNVAVPVPVPVPVVPTAPPVVATPQPAIPLPGVTRPGVPGAAVPGTPGTPVAPGAATPAAVTAVAPGQGEEEVFPAGIIRFQDADLIQVLELYQELTGRTVMRPASLPQTKITIRSQTPLTRREAIMALDTILAMNQITMIPQGEKFVKAVAQGQAVTEAKEFSEIPPEDLEETTRFITQIVQLKNALPREVAPALQPLAKMPGSSIMAIDSSGILVLRDYEENIKRMLELLERIDVVPQQEFDSIVIPIKYALAADIAQVLGSLTAGGGGPTTVGRQTTRTGLTGAGGTTGAPGTPGYPGSTGIPGQPGYNPNAALGGGGAGGLGSAAAGRSSFQDRLRQIVNRAAASGDITILGNTKIIADERTNSLLIFASKADLATISNIIEKLDVVLPQVLIEALIMEIALDESLNYGFNYVQRRPSSSGSFTGIGAIKNIDILDASAFGGSGTNGVLGIPKGFSYAARIDDFTIAATAAAQDSRVNILSRPRIQTSHAVEANLFVGRTRPYVTGSYSYFGGGPQTQFQQQQIGITLSVLPLINPEGLVVMDIRQKVQSIGNEIPIDANFSVPETIDREANAKVSVRDKETIILGGFINSERRKTKSGVPILKDLPLLGYLFSANTKSEVRNELMVLIRPTVLPTPSDAAIAAQEEKSKMPGIVAAEKDYSEAERKRLDKIANELYKREGFRSGAQVTEQHP